MYQRLLKNPYARVKAKVSAILGQKNAMEITEEVLEQLNNNPLYNTVGIRVMEVSNGKAHSRLSPDARLCWPFPNQPHGGVLFTLMDTTMAWAVFSQLEPGLNCTTVNLDIQYTRPARGDAFNCNAWTTYRTGHLSFVRAEIQDSRGKLLAMGQGTFRVIRMDFSS